MTADGIGILIEREISKLLPQEGHEHELDDYAINDVRGSVEILSLNGSKEALPLGSDCMPLLEPDPFNPDVPWARTPNEATIWPSVIHTVSVDSARHGERVPKEVIVEGSE